MCPLHARIGTSASLMNVKWDRKCHSNSYRSVVLTVYRFVIFYFSESLSCTSASHSLLVIPGLQGLSNGKCNKVWLTPGIISMLCDCSKVAIISMRFKLAWCLLLLGDNPWPLWKVRNLKLTPTSTELETIHLKSQVGSNYLSPWSRTQFCIVLHILQGNSSFLERVVKQYHHTLTGNQSRICIFQLCFSAYQPLPEFK